MAALGRDLDALEGGHPQQSGTGLDHLVVLQHVDLAGGREDGRDVGRHQGRLVGPARDQGRAPAGGDHQVGLGAGHDRHRERPVHPLQTGPEGVTQVHPLGQGLLHQVGQDLGIGLRPQLVAGGHQLVAQLDVVLDDPVVNQGHPAGAVDVGVGIGLRRAPVGGPPGVADAGGGAGRRVVDGRGQLGQLPRPSPHPDPVSVHQGDAGRVVAPVLQPGQPVEEQRERGPAPGDADDAAHVPIFSRPPTPRGATSRGSP